MQPPNGQSGAPGMAGDQFNGKKYAPADAEYPVQEFIRKVLADEFDGLAELISSTKAKGKAKQIREGKISDEYKTELKAVLGKLKLVTSKNLRGVHVILMDESGSQGTQFGMNDGGYDDYGNRKNKGKKAKPGKKAQFKVVSEGGTMVITEIDIH